MPCGRHWSKVPGGPSTEEVAAHPWVRDDWVAATAAGVRVATVALHAELTAIHRGLNASPPDFVPAMRPIGNRPAQLKREPALAFQADDVGTDAWLGSRTPDIGRLPDHSHTA